MMEINKLITQHAKQISNSIDSMITQKYIEKFGISPFVPGTKFLTNEAQDNFKKYEVKLINEKYDFQGHIMTYSVEGVEIVKIEEVNNDNIIQKENTSNM